MYVLNIAITQPVNFSYMKCDVPELKGDNYKGFVEQYSNVRELLKAIDAQFVTSNKALASTYGPFKISYKTHKDKWSINELMTMCVLEEGRLAMEEGEKVNFIVPRKKKYQAKQKGKSNIPPQSNIKKELKHFFCKKKGHIKKNCSKFKNSLDKKGTQVSFVCYESNMIDVNHNTWWNDSGSSIHVTNSLQGLHDLQKPVESEQSIYSGNKMPSQVEAVGTCKLVLSSGFILSLERTFYVHGFSRNLISVSKLVSVGYLFNFSDFSFSLSNKSEIVGYGTLSDKLFRLNLQNDDNYATMLVHENVGIK
nr:uncharacterized protein LOC125422950 [Ziziphus jujuba var. spinosa]